MTIQQYPTAETAESPAVEAVAEFAYWQLLLGAETRETAAGTIFALVRRLQDALDEIWPRWEIICPFDQTALGSPLPERGLSFCPACNGMVEPNVRAARRVQ